MSTGGVSKAYYGNGYLGSSIPGMPNTVVDVTTYIQGQWNSHPNNFSLYVDDYIAGYDPAPGKLKTLYVFYNNGKADAAMWNTELDFKK